MTAAASQTTGTTIREAMAATGMTRKQLENHAATGKIRSRKAGKYRLLHPEDVQALAASVWQGQAWKPEAAK